MAFPPDLLSDDEEIVVDMHPHWWTITPPGLALGASVVFGLVVVAAAGDGWLWGIAQFFVGLLVLAAAGYFAIAWARWITTEFVVTTERVISRKGVISKEGIEIPLDRINTVFFSQKPFERLAGSGDLGIESAGEGGRQTFTNIRRPNRVQSEIYAQKEAYEQSRFERLGHAAAPPAPSIPEQIAQLDELRRRGTISDEEFEAKKDELLRRM